MNSFLINYVKRDAWLDNGKNLGIVLNEKQKLIETGIAPRKALKKIKKVLWKGLKN